MTSSLALAVLQRLRQLPDDDTPLDVLARQTGASRFQVQRRFAQLAGESPKAYTLRLRLERAAARLATTGDRVIDIAFDHGFASHEVFTRAFRRHFGRSPQSYRVAMHSDVSAPDRSRHQQVVHAVGPCVHLFHLPSAPPVRRSVMPTVSIERQEIAAQPVLFVRARIARHELAAAIGSGIGQSYMQAQKAGVALAGRPFARYPDVSAGLMTVECGMPVAAPASGEGAVEAGTLHGGPVVVAMHAGHYEQLTQTYAAIERWMEEHGLQKGGAPWESYLTDPAEHPDPADWRTLVYWPIAV